MKNPLIAIAAAALCLPLAISPVAASNPNELQYKDLDLDSAAGKATLDRRISAVARRVCEGEVTTGTRLSSAACKEAVRAEVLAQITEQQNRVGKGG
ncbi:MAG: UrcA family protein [Novosphingobium sp.]